MRYLAMGVGAILMGQGSGVLDWVCKCEKGEGVTAVMCTMEEDMVWLHVSRVGCARREREPEKGSIWLVDAVHELRLLGLSSVAWPAGWKEALPVHVDLGGGGGGRPWVGAIVKDG